MKGRNRFLLVAILGILTAALATGIYLDYLSYQQWVQERLSRYPVEVHPYIEFTPYFRTSRGFLWMTISVVVYGVFFLVVILQGIKRQKPRGYPMTSVNEQGRALSPTPLEFKLADVLFFAIRKNLMVFKDLTASKYVHYTMIVQCFLMYSSDLSPNDCLSKLTRMSRYSSRRMSKW